MKKIIASTIALSALALFSAVPAFAASADTMGKGSEAVYEGQELTESKDQAAAQVRPRFFSYAVYEAQAPDKVVHSLTPSARDGGYWIRGTITKEGVRHVYSSYKHYKKSGAASVINGEGDYRDGGYKSPNVFSTATVKWTRTGKNMADYRSK